MPWGKEIRPRCSAALSWGMGHCVALVLFSLAQILFAGSFGLPLFILFSVTKLDFDVY